MNYLLDTHVFMWLALEPDRLSPSLRTTLDAPTNNLYLSTASVWEMQIKAMIGKLPLPVSVQEFVLTQRAVATVQSLPIIERHVWTLAQLPHHHRDPFDRLLIAQALTEGYTIVSFDSVFTDYTVPLLRD